MGLYCGLRKTNKLFVCLFICKIRFLSFVNVNTTLIERQILLEIRWKNVLIYYLFESRYIKNCVRDFNFEQNFVITIIKVNKITFIYAPIILLNECNDNTV